MSKIPYIIDGTTHEVSVVNSPDFLFGKGDVLSTEASDIAFSQSWYNEGFKAIRFLSDEEFLNLRHGLNSCIEKLIKNELNISVDNFELSRYHEFVTSDEDHYKIVSKTRDLFPADFNFPVLGMLPKFEVILGFKLTDIDPNDGTKIHIIIRINRPFSTDFNPPHKDIYEGVDAQNHIPQFINLWIPICGVTRNSSLPIAPYSHLLPERQVVRTFDGGVVEGKKYRVRMIKEWGGKNDLVRAKVGYGEVLFFTSHLIHGLAINQEPNTTRVALEFRLFKQ